MVVVACLLLLAGCSGAGGLFGEATTAGSAAPAGTGLRYVAGKAEEAALLARMRAVDVCALHDPSVAAAVTDDAPRDIAPYEGFDMCRLRMTSDAGSGLDTWELRVGVIQYGAQLQGQEGVIAEQIGGVTVLRRVDFSSDSECGYVLPFPEAGGIDLQASAQPEDRNKPPCTVVKEYLAAVLPIWRTMPLRPEGLTEPRLTLAEKDPCALADVALPIVDPDGAPAATTGAGGPVTCDPTRVSPPPRRERLLPEVPRREAP